MQVELKEAQTNLESLIQRSHQEEIEITKNGKVIGRLCPPKVKSSVASILSGDAEGMDWLALADQNLDDFL
ncbi:MAG: hypothetical protein SOS22_04610 [Absicoccus sp.]|uniref:Antitoxin n=1 Tax=Absicoccus intestinalis TaxID=2926319 RepID=A0ABU4WIV6_9FIRM|nr:MULTISPECIES: hypothetical protein [unclassified Absicoccus]MDX8416482.1 hypothetical protein [Absicoccus sp. CLA-KB-P134]MDY3035482.1 hypothetical protein [Absicoccus sp.]